MLFCVTETCISLKTKYDHFKNQVTQTLSFNRIYNNMYKTFTNEIKRNVKIKKNTQQILGDFKCKAHQNPVKNVNKSF